jgi:FemAB-related protein (PEP-CTERM system-associated)
MPGVRLLDAQADGPRWDEFVTAHPEGTFFHLHGWRRVIEASFGHRTHFLLSERDGAIDGVLPLAEVRSRLFGHKLVSLPFCVYGGIVAADEGSRAALLAAASALARRTGVDYLELRNRQDRPGLPVSARYVTFRRALDPDPEANMNAIPRKQRAMIRKGAAKGLVPRFGAPVEAFFRIYAESLRNLGTPVLPLRFFAALQREFGESCEVMSVSQGEGAAPVAAVMSFYFRDEVLPYYGGGTALARECHAYDFMYWELLVHALARGARVFDFGRSRQGTGSYRFKTHWGFEPAPLHYQYDMVAGGELPNFTPDNPRYEAMIRLWRRLPLPVTTVIGPWLARDLG